MTRRYEIVYIFDSARDESQINESLDRHHALLKTEGESEFIIESNHWGRRTLAYPIGKSEVGYYVVVNLKTDGSKLNEFERSVKLDESIIRYLIVLNEGEIPVPIQHSEEQNDDEDERPPRRAHDRVPAAAVADRDKPETSEEDEA